MDFEFTEEQRAVRDVARRIVADKIDPLLSSLPEEPLPREDLLQVFEWLKPLGYLGARVPERLGGAEIGYLTQGALMEVLPPAIAIDVLAQEAAATRIALSATEEQSVRFLEPLLEGIMIAGSATSEPGVGSNPREVRAHARRDGDDYVLNGQKMWVSNGAIADVLMTVVRMDGPDGEPTTGRLLVERADSPFEAREVDTIGLRHGHLAEVFFADCRVPARNVLGDAGDFHRFLTRTWLAQRPLFGLMAAHLADRALQAAVSYAKDRHQFGKAIASYQLVQEMIVEIATAVDVSRLLAYRALWMLDQGGWPHKESSMAKSYATEAAIKATSMAIQVHGSYGLTREYGIEKLLRDARMLTLPEGTTQIQQLIMGRELLGVRAY
jgi:alkylation response protein AidB-like acyl-CoA dehydrogenase